MIEAPEDLSFLKSFLNHLAILLCSPNCVFACFVHMLETKEMDARVITKSLGQIGTHGLWAGHP